MIFLSIETVSVLLTLCTSENSHETRKLISVLSAILMSKQKKKTCGCKVLTNFAPQRTTTAPLPLRSVLDTTCPLQPHRYIFRIHEKHTVLKYLRPSVMLFTWFSGWCSLDMARDLTSRYFCRGLEISRELV